MENDRPEKDPNPVGEATVQQPHSFQKKALLFKTLAILWVVPSLTSLFVLAYQFPKAPGVLETLRSIRLEQWLSLILLLLHPLFIYLAGHYRKTELPTEVVEELKADEPDPGSL